MINIADLFKDISYSLLVALATSVLIKIFVGFFKEIIYFVNGKDRKVSKYIILSPINDNLVNVDEIKAFFGFIMDVAEIYLVLLIIYLVMIITQKAEFFDWSKGNIGAYFLLLVCMITTILFGIASRIKLITKPYYHICCCVIGLLLGSCCEFVLTTYLLQNYYNISYTIFLMFISCLYDWVLVEIIYNSFRYRYLAAYKKIKCIRVIRSIGAVLCIICMFGDAFIIIYHQFGKWIYFVLILLWLILCFLEFFSFIDNIQSNTMVQFKICMQNNCDQVQSRIYQYKGNKIKYVLDNGCIKIIDNNEILSIDYMLKRFYVKKKKKVTCLLKNGDVLLFDGYKFIRTSWISFYKINENVKYVKIINSMRIREILSEN